LGDLLREPLTVRRAAPEASLRVAEPRVRQAREPSVVLAIRAWLGTWAGIEHIVAGMAR